MTREEIIGMVREADPFGEHGRLFELAQLTPETLERFAALVAAKEREECAKVCESYDIHVGEYFAKEIRRRGMQ